MLIYQAQTSRNRCAFTNREAAAHWVEQNASYNSDLEPYWKKNGPDCWVLCSGISGYQVGAVYEIELETVGETDPLRQLALAILEGDPQALDAARDILRC